MVDITERQPKETQSKFSRFSDAPPSVVPVVKPENPEKTDEEKNDFKRKIGELGVGDKPLGLEQL